MNRRANARVFGWCPNYLSMDATVASSSALTAQDFPDPRELAKAAAPPTVDTRVFLSQNKRSQAVFSVPYHQEIHGPAKENPLVHDVGPALYVDLDYNFFELLTPSEIRLWRGTSGNEKYNFIFDAPKYVGLVRNFCVHAGGFYTGQLLSVLMYRAENGLLHEPFNIGASRGHTCRFLETNPKYTSQQLLTTEYERGLREIHDATKSQKEARVKAMAEYNKPFVDSLNNTLTGVEEVRVQVQQLPAA